MKNTPKLKTMPKTDSLVGDGRHSCNGDALAAWQLTCTRDHRATPVKHWPGRGRCHHLLLPCHPIYF